MYIWVGCKLPDAFEQKVRGTCLALNERIGLDTVAFELPQHVSLKISFQSDRYEEILEDLTGYLSEQSSFTVRIFSAEQFGAILWMPVEENEQLCRLHRELDERMERRFGVTPHEFDRCFKFHSTLFMDPDEEKVRQMQRLLTGYPLAQELTVNTFLLGFSETGKPGQCRIVREIKV